MCSSREGIGQGAVVGRVDLLVRQQTQGLRAAGGALVVRWRRWFSYRCVWLPCCGAPKARWLRAPTAPSSRDGADHAQGGPRFRAQSWLHRLRHPLQRRVVYQEEPHMPAPKEHGRHRTHDLREILDAVFYVLKSGCQWRLLPRDFPRWLSVYHYFRAWHIDGTWERINRAIRERLRVRLGRDPQPSAGVVDSQGRSRAPRWAEKIGVTTVARRSSIVRATFWWTPRVSCSKPRSKAPRRDEH
jgi:transposase